VAKRLASAFVKMASVATMASVVLAPSTESVRYSVYE